MNVLEALLLWFNYKQNVNADRKIKKFISEKKYFIINILGTSEIEKK